MNIKKTLLVLLILLVITSANLTTAAAQDAPVVRAVLFYSTTCPHCEYVINEVLIPMIETYGQQMLVIGVNVSTEEGSTLFLEMIDQIGYPPDQAGVPFLLVAETVLVGSQEIPEVFPGMVEEGLAGDGIAWPEVQAVRDFLVGQGYLNAEGVDVTPTPNPGQPTKEAAQDAPTPTNPPEDTLTPTETNQPGADPQDESGESDGITRLDDESPLESITMFDRFNLDPLGNGISVIVLLLMIGVVAWIGIQFMQATTPKMWASWILPVLLVIGIAIAAYLASIELTGNEAICGPVGDCNAVQQSEYAKLFGFLPVAVFGLIGYFLIGASWLVARRSTGRLQFYGKMGMFVFALLGLLFFVYLTFLEPFVIGATCAWCLTSGILMILINLYATPVALNAWAEMDIDDYLEDDEA